MATGNLTIVKGSILQGNKAVGGPGGTPGAGGAGGKGGSGANATPSPGGWGGDGNGGAGGRGGSGGAGLSGVGGGMGGSGVGGGIAVYGGSAAFFNAFVIGNAAVGGPGHLGAPGGPGGSAGKGGNGIARSVSVPSNGGAGGTGGQGGFPGLGGRGGTAAGGGCFVRAGVLTLVASFITGDKANGGVEGGGGSGGAGGQAGAAGHAGTGTGGKHGKGGRGGGGGSGGAGSGGLFALTGGNAYGGGLGQVNGTVALYGDSISACHATGGNGGLGDKAAAGKPPTAPGGPGGSGGNGGHGGFGGPGGKGGVGDGGGIFLGGGALSVIMGSIAASQAMGGNGNNASANGTNAINGNGAPGNATVAGGIGGGGSNGKRSFNAEGGAGGAGQGGAVCVTGGHLNIAGATFKSDQAVGGNGGNGAPGKAGVNGGAGASGYLGGNAGPGLGGDWGGGGGNGGAADGGGIYLASSGTIVLGGGSISSCTLTGGKGGNGAAAGAAGNGGAGGATADPTRIGGYGGAAGTGGQGGFGGTGGAALGGSAFVASGNTMLVNGTNLGTGILHPGQGGTPGTGTPAGSPGPGGAGNPTGFPGSTNTAGADGSPGANGKSGGAQIEGSQTTNGAGQTASRLVVSPMPPSVIEGVPFPASIYVVAVDSSGNLVPSFSANLTVSAPLSQLGGTLTVSPHNGVAVFSGLTLSTGGGTLSLTISGGGFMPQTNSFRAIGYTPAQIRSAYGFNSLPTDANGHALDGTGQTIAIIDSFDDPNVFNDLDWFDTTFGLLDTGPSLYQQYGAASTFLTVVNQNGLASPLPPINPSPSLETILDVEWAHAIAPGAHIDLVEYNGGSGNTLITNLMTAVTTAGHLHGVSVVSMSLGLNEAANPAPPPPTPPAAYPNFPTITPAQELQFDNLFNVPGVTFVAASGDYGIYDASYPAFSPNVLAVGGSSLSINADGSYGSETGFGRVVSGVLVGSGGGVSLVEPTPVYQNTVQTNANRTIPDVSFFADPRTGGATYTSFTQVAGQNFASVAGGTSLSTPCLAGLIAMANQGRAALNKPLYNQGGPTEIQTAVYSFPAADYHDNLGGNNGTNQVGLTDPALYDEVTGLGTPVVNLFVPDLIAWPKGQVSSPFEPVTISGQKFNDLNGNGAGPRRARPRGLDHSALRGRHADRHHRHRCERRL